MSETTIRGSARVAERYRAGVLDTCTYIDLDLLSAEDLPVFPMLTAVTMAELQQGVAMARDPGTRAARMEKLGAAVADFEPLPSMGRPPHDTGVWCPWYLPPAAIPGLGAWT